jgi:hypothetical protein
MHVKQRQGVPLSEIVFSHLSVLRKMHPVFGGRIPFLGTAFSEVGIRGMSSGRTILYASVLKGSVADFFNNIRHLLTSDTLLRSGRDR